MELTVSPVNMKNKVNLVINTLNMKNLILQGTQVSEKDKVHKLALQRKFKTNVGNNKKELKN